jgi:integrase/recombinase XerD
MSAPVPAVLEPVDVLSSFDDPSIARRELARYLRGRSDVPDLDLGRSPTAPGEVAVAFLIGCRSKATRHAYASDLADWFCFLDAESVLPLRARRITVDAYALRPLRSGKVASPATISRRLACVSGFFDYAVDQRLVNRNPVDGARRPRVPENVSTLGLSKPQVRRLLQVARQAGARETALICLLLHLGLRISEAVGADIEDLGEQQGHRVLGIQGKGQESKTTAVPLNAAVQAAVDACIAERVDGAILVTRSGKRLTRQHAGTIVRAVSRQAGLPPVNPHALRHTFVTLALNEGASLRDVQDAARHADPRTTRRYDRDRHNLSRHPTHRLLDALEG